MLHGECSRCGKRAHYLVESKIQARKLNLVSERRAGCKPMMINVAYIWSLHSFMKHNLAHPRMTARPYATHSVSNTYRPFAFMSTFSCNYVATVIICHVGIPKLFGFHAGGGRSGISHPPEFWA